MYLIEHLSQIEVYLFNLSGLEDFKKLIAIKQSKLLTNAINEKEEVTD